MRFSLHRTVPDTPVFQGAAVKRALSARSPLSPVISARGAAWRGEEIGWARESRCERASSPSFPAEIRIPASPFLQHVANRCRERAEGRANAGDDRMVGRRSPHWIRTALDIPHRRGPSCPPPDKSAATPTISSARVLATGYGEMVDFKTKPVRSRALR